MGDLPAEAAALERRLLAAWWTDHEPTRSARLWALWERALARRARRHLAAREVA